MSEILELHIIHHNIQVFVRKIINSTLKFHGQAAVQRWDTVYRSLLFPCSQGLGFSRKLSAVVVASLHSLTMKIPRSQRFDVSPVLACTSIYTLENTPDFNESENKKPRTTGYTWIDFWKEIKGEEYHSASHIFHLT